MLPAETHIASVSLKVKDLPLLKRFYSEIVGLTTVSESPGSISLGVGSTAIFSLYEDKEAAFAPPGHPGLYHTAFLFESKAALAQAVSRITQMAPSLYEGSADHLVSQAFYLHDPEGNGIELYVDRPRSEWKWQNGSVMMDSLPLDPFAFVQKYSTDTPKSDVSIGHIHLKVHDVAESEYFYVDLLGFDIVAKLPSALFISAGGYHHHIGLNTWESLGGGKQGPERGLKEFVISLGSTHAVTALEKRLQGADVSYSSGKDYLELDDPSGIHVRVTS